MRRTTLPHSRPLPAGQRRRAPPTGCEARLGHPRLLLVPARGAGAEHRLHQEFDSERGAVGAAGD